MTRLILCLLFGGLGFVSAADDPAPKVEAKKRTPPKYETKANHDPDGIGKFYMGREIAQVMGFNGAGWLERPERAQEEAPAKLIKALDLKPGMVVADVGAGSGYYTFLMAPLVGDKGKVLASDIQQQMLNLIKDKAKKNKVTNVETVKGTVTNPKLPAGGVELILLVDVYHEFDHPYEMAEKMVDALKPGGRLVFVEYRLEDEKVPIKLVHKMSERQVIKEMEPFPEMKHDKTVETLPWQHVIIFAKKDDAGKDVTVKEVRADAFIDAVKAKKGKVVYIDCWATWCVPCVKKFPHLVELNKKYADKGLVCMSLSMDKAGDPDEYKQDKVLKFLKEKGAAFPNFIVEEPRKDEDELMKAIGDYSAIPYMVLFDRSGKRVWTSDKKLTDEQLDKLIEEQLAEKP